MFYLMNRLKISKILDSCNANSEHLHQPSPSNRQRNKWTEAPGTLHPLFNRTSCQQLMCSAASRASEGEGRRGLNICSRTKTGFQSHLQAGEGGRRMSLQLQRERNPKSQTGLRPPGNLLFPGDQRGTEPVQFSAANGRQTSRNCR